MSCNEPKGCPCPGTHLGAPTLPNLRLDATGRFLGSRQHGWVQAGQRVPQQDRDAPSLHRACFPSLHRAGEGESE